MNEKPKKKGRPWTPDRHERPLHARQRRLAEVEEAMLTRLTSGQIEQEIAARFGCAPRTVRYDLAAVRKKWEEEDARTIAHRRRLVLRRLERLSGLAASKGQLALAVAAEVALARCLGLIQSTTLVDKGLFLAGAQTVEAAGKIEQFRRQVTLLRQLEPSLRRAALLEARPNGEPAEEQTG